MDQNSNISFHSQKLSATFEFSIPFSISFVPLFDYVVKLVLMFLCCRSCCQVSNFLFSLDLIHFAWWIRVAVFLFIEVFSDRIFAFCFSLISWRIEFVRSHQFVLSFLSQSHSVFTTCRRIHLMCRDIVFRCVDVFLPLWTYWCAVVFCWTFFQKLMNTSIVSNLIRFPEHLHSLSPVRWIVTKA